MYSIGASKLWNLCSIIFGVHISKRSLSWVFIVFSRRILELLQIEKFFDARILLNFWSTCRIRKFLSNPLVKPIFPNLVQPLYKNGTYRQIIWLNFQEKTLNIDSVKPDYDYQYWNSCRLVPNTVKHWLFGSLALIGPHS